MRKLVHVRYLRKKDLYFIGKLGKTLVVQYNLKEAAKEYAPLSTQKYLEEQFLAVKATLRNISIGWSFSKTVQYRRQSQLFVRFK